MVHQQIHVKTTSSETQGFTVVLCVSATGRTLKPMIIYKGAASIAHVRGQKNGYYIDHELLHLDLIR